MRRQAVLFLSGEASTAVQDLRRTWDPQEADRIGPHLTLVYELDASPSVRHELEEVAAAARRFHLWLGKTIRWGQPDDGIAIEVVDHEGGLGQLLTQLQSRGFRTTGKPHITLVHGRSVGIPDLDRAWSSLRDQDLRARHPVERLAVIERRTERWVPVYECRLGGNAD